MSFVLSMSSMISGESDNNVMTPSPAMEAL